MSKITCKYCLAILKIPTSNAKARLRTTLEFSFLHRWQYLGEGKAVCQDCNLLKEEAFK